MNTPLRQSAEGRPQLLISVRNAVEAADALAGGANIIDVKEPSRGPLGAADNQVVQQVLRFVNGRRQVSVAAGELVDAIAMDSTFPIGVQWVKFGLANCARDDKWAARFALLRNQLPIDARIVPVIYADHRAACAPAPEEILQVAQDCNCHVILVDTFDKTAGTLFEHWSFSEVEKFVTQAHANGMAIALAGGLRDESIVLAAAIGADVIGVRGAVCDDGRLGNLRRDQVELLAASLRDASAISVSI